MNVNTAFWHHTSIVCLLVSFLSLCTAVDLNAGQSGSTLFKITPSEKSGAGHDGRAISDSYHGLRVTSIPSSHDDQRYGRGVSHPSDFISSGWDDGFQISSFSWADDNWVAFVSKQTLFGGQAWRARSSTFADVYASFLNDRPLLSVVEIAYRPWSTGRGQWTLTGGGAPGITGQIWRQSPDFPNGFITSYQSDGYRISDVAYGDGEWVVMLSKMPSFGEQRYSVSDTFPATFIVSNWRRGYHITEVSYGNDRWVVVMTHLGAANAEWELGRNWQELSIHSEFPEDEIQTAWNHGLQVTDLVFGDGVYVLTTTTKLGEVMGAPPPVGGVLSAWRHRGRSTSNAALLVVDVFLIVGGFQGFRGLSGNDFAVCSSHSFDFRQESFNYYIQSRSASPYSAAFLMDQSGSITGTDPSDLRIDAARVFMGNLATNDEVALLAFADGGSLPYSPVTIYQDGNRKFTKNPNGLDSALDLLASAEGGGTPLYDSVKIAVNYTSANAVNERRAVLVFTDGDDTASDSTLDDAIGATVAQDIPLHTVGLSDGVNVDVLLRMADETNGSFVQAAEARQLMSYVWELAVVLGQ